MPVLNVLLSSSEIQSALNRISREIAERNSDPANVLVVGIQKGGVHLAERLAKLLESLWGHPVAVGFLDVGMHRDDLSQRLAPEVHPTRIPGDITGKTVVLVDDVLFSGRTTRAAMDALNDFGRPRAIQLAVLIDRGNRQLPIKPDCVGQTLSISLDQRVTVTWAEDGQEDLVTLERT
jgi:pyrimidine operon attenuation protein / uracil phosphoribosyltransferase